MTESQGSNSPLELIQAERERQNFKWGEQNHPDGTGPHFKRKADLHREVTNIASELGVVTWRHILLEEVWEAMAESDPLELAAELIQVAAVATQWVEAIARREDAERTIPANARQSHNHGIDPSCREALVDGWPVGECLR